ncbi:MAG TPA: SGNH/GDSL hydrolase family protein [Pirellulales bacterium]|jgi:hypothetical protein
MATPQTASEDVDTRAAANANRQSVRARGQFADASSQQASSDLPAKSARDVADQGAAKAKGKTSGRDAKRSMRVIAFKWTTLLATLAVLLLLAEGATRLFSDVTPPLLLNHPVLGMTYLPNYADEVFVPECEHNVFLRFNSDGMRGGAVAVEKPAGVRRVAVLGDSFIAAVATDEDKTIVRLVEEQLNASDKSTRWEVINFGVSASSTGQELVLYRELVRKYKPDVVVCAFCVMNDLGDNCRRLTSARARIYFDLGESGELVQQPHSAKRATINAWLNRHSRFYVWQRYASQKAIETIREGAQKSSFGAWLDLGVADPGGQGIFVTSPEGDLAHAWKITEKLIETMHAEVRADGAEFLLAVLPAGVQLCDDFWGEPTDENAAATERYYPDQRLSETCNRIGAPILLLTDRFREASPHHSSECEAEWLHYGGMGHFNDHGNAIAADALAQALRLRYERGAMRNESLLNR